MKYQSLFSGKNKKHPGSWMVSPPDFRSWGHGFKSHWRQDLAAHDCMVLHCTKPSSISVWLKLCLKGHKTPNYHDHLGKINKKNVLSLSSAECLQRVVKVKGNLRDTTCMYCSRNVSFCVFHHEVTVFLLLMRNNEDNKINHNTDAMVIDPNFSPLFIITSLYP